MQFGALFLALLFLWWGSAYADEANSNKDRIRPDVINGGGLDFSKSTNYLLSDSIGESVVGYGGTTNYTLNAGYRQPSASDYISLSCSPTATIASAAVGQKTGSGTCVVYTDAYSGYNLSWAILSGSGGTNTGYLINQYNDAIAPFDFSRSGLVGYWKMDEATAGSTVQDYSGNLHDLTPNGVGGANNLPQPVSDIPSNMNTADSRSLNFDGTDDYLRASTYSGFPASTMTMCAWVRTSGNTEYIASINRNPTNITNEGIFQVDPAGKLLFWDYNGSSFGFDATTVGNTALNNSVWHHACFVKNGTSGTYYLDGASDGTKTAALNITYGTSDFIVGANFRDSNSYFNGTIDDVRIYNRALSLAEIQALYRTPHTWSVGASAVAWGSRLRSSSTDTDVKWGTDNSTDKWMNIGDGNYSVVRRLSATPLSGSNEIFQYRAEIGSSAFQPTGLYQATAIFTAVGD